MSEKTFTNIISQLEEINYRGEISIFSNNEPLLDNRIFDFIDYAKSKLPKAHHSLYTNGILLNEEKFSRLVNSLDRLYIDNYSDDMIIQENIKNLVDAYKFNDLKCEVFILMRKKNQILDSRGGSAPNRRMDKKFFSTCMAPFMQLIVRPDGKISRCCQDALGKTTLGDVTKENIEKIWNNDAYNNLREMLQSGKRNQIFQCQYCDIFGNVVYFGKEWRQIIGNVVLNIVINKHFVEEKDIYIYGHSKKVYRLLEYLTFNGIKVSGIIDQIESEELYNDNCFILFESVNCEILDRIDCKNVLVGKKYIICDLILDIQDSNLNNDLLLSNKITEQLKKMYDCNKKIIIFGTGGVARKFIKKYKNIEKRIIAFADNNIDNNIKDFAGKKIIDPMKIKEYDSISVLIASSYVHDIEKQLLENNLCLAEEIINGYILSF